MAVRILEKFVLSREVLLLVSAIVVDRSYLRKDKLADPRADYALQVSTWNYKCIPINVGRTV
jgi:hypothetical protein